MSHAIARAAPTLALAARGSARTSVDGRSIASVPRPSPRSSSVIHVGWSGARVQSRAVAARASDDAAGSRPTPTEMYVALREMEAAAEEAESACAQAATSSAEQSACTVAFLDAAEEIEQARLSVAAAGAGVAEERDVARAAVKKARQDRVSALESAAADELACVQSGGGAECTVAFNDAWDRAEEHQRDAVRRHRTILKRWVKAHKSR